MKKMYLNNEEIRVKQITELDKMIEHIEELNIQQNRNLKIQEEQIITLREEQKRYEQPTALPVPGFNIEGGYYLLQQLERFGSVQDTTRLYTEKKSPVTRFRNEGRERGNLTGQVGLTLDEDQIIYVADLNNKRIQLFYADGKLKEQFGKGQVVTPYSIALYDKWVFVCDRNLNFVIKFVRGSYKFVNKSVDGELSYPQGITTDRNGDLFVADGYRDRLAIFSVDLIYIREIGKGLPSCPRDVKLTINEIFVADNNIANNVHIFSRSGHPLRSMIELENGSSNIFFCLDLFSNILISDYAANSIQIYAINGELINRIDCEGHPTGIAVTANHSIICALFHYVITIY